VSHLTKQFSEKLNRSLDELGVPINNKERTLILSKMLDIPRQHAWNLLEGHLLPDPAMWEKIQSEFEIE
jgi:hypothetical protein